MLLHFKGQTTDQIYFISVESCTGGQYCYVGASSAVDLGYFLSLEVNQIQNWSVTMRKDYRCADFRLRKKIVWDGPLSNFASLSSACYSALVSQFDLLLY